MLVRNYVGKLILLLWIADTAGQDSKRGFALRQAWRIVDLAYTSVPSAFSEAKPGAADKTIDNSVTSEDTHRVVDA
jgi:hypothetical protein